MDPGLGLLCSCVFRGCPERLLRNQPPPPHFAMLPPLFPTHPFLLGPPPSWLGGRVLPFESHCCFLPEKAERWAAESRVPLLFVSFSLARTPQRSEVTCLFPSSSSLHCRPQQGLAFPIACCTLAGEGGCPLFPAHPRPVPLPGAGRGGMGQVKGVVHPALKESFLRRPEGWSQCLDHVFSPRHLQLKILRWKVV